MRKLLILSFIWAISICLLPLSNPPSAKARAEIKNDKVKGQILVKFKNSANLAVINSVINSNKAKVIEKLNALDTFVLSVPDIASDAVINALAKNPNVEFAEENAIATIQDFPITQPNDSYYATSQWGLENTGQNILGQIGTVDADIDAQQAWTRTTGSVRIAILDTGIDNTHPDISAKIYLSNDFTASTNGIKDIYGHGTHVAGIAAASTNNSTGIAGVCPDCHILVGKVLDDSGSGAYSWIANGIIWAADNNAKVINMSLGGPTKSRTLENAINYAWSKGVVIVAAAGNSGNQSKIYPGSYQNVIAVAATDNRDKKAYFSSYGTWVDVAAPGQNIYSTFPTYSYTIGKSLNYDYASGTSMATPMAAGTAGLIWSTSYGLSNISVRSRLETTSDRIPGTGSYWMYGRINAGRAVTP